MRTDADDAPWPSLRPVDRAAIAAQNRVHRSIYGFNESPIAPLFVSQLDPTGPSQPDGNHQEIGGQRPWQSSRRLGAGLLAGLWGLF